jgi:hypothetical protein
MEGDCQGISGAGTFIAFDHSGTATATFQLLAPCVTHTQHRRVRELRCANICGSPTHKMTSWIWHVRALLNSVTDANSRAWLERGGETSKQATACFGNTSLIGDSQRKLQRRLV